MTQKLNSYFTMENERDPTTHSDQLTDWCNDDDDVRRFFPYHFLLITTAILRFVVVGHFCALLTLICSMLLLLTMNCIAKFMETDLFLMQNKF